VRFTTDSDKNNIFKQQTKTNGVMYKKVKEGKAEVYVPVEAKVSKELPVFYNPVMEFNRTVSVLVLNALNKKDMRIALPLAGTGVRAARFKAELNKGMIKELYVNDGSEEAVKIIKKNLKAKISKQEANKFLLENQGFVYIDIDPFGTPNPFLDAAVKRISRNGVLAVTATDTACLCGTYPTACKRKYYSKPIRCEQMHEIGLRILIRKVQLIASQYEKALTPIFSYSKDHYFRIFFKADSGKKKTDDIIKQHGHVSFDRKTGELSTDNYDGEIGGPLWLGKLYDPKLAKKIAKDNKFLETIALESKINTIGFYHIHSICKKNKIKDLPRHEKIIQAIRKKGFKAERTHFSDIGIKSNIGFKEMIKILRK